MSLTRPWMLVGLRKLKMNSPDINDPTKHIKVACRLCGDVWTFPMIYKDSFDSDRGWECPNCRRVLKEWGR